MFHLSQYDTECRRSLQICLGTKRVLVIHSRHLAGYHLPDRKNKGVALDHLAEETLGSSPRPLRKTGD